MADLRKPPLFTTRVPALDPPAAPTPDPPPGPDRPEVAAEPIGGLGEPGLRELITAGQRFAATVMRICPPPAG